MVHHPTELIICRLKCNPGGTNRVAHFFCLIYQLRPAEGERSPVALETIYPEPLNHGRLYPSIDRLVEKGLIIKQTNQVISTALHMQPSAGKTGRLKNTTNSCTLSSRLSSHHIFPTVDSSQYSSVTRQFSLLVRCANVDLAVLERRPVGDERRFRRGRSFPRPLPRQPRTRPRGSRWGRWFGGPPGRRRVRCDVDVTYLAVPHLPVEEADLPTMGCE